MNFIRRFKGPLIAAVITAIILIISFYLPEQTKESFTQNVDVTASVETIEPAVEKPLESAAPAKNKTEEISSLTPTPALPVKTNEPAEVPKETASPMATPAVSMETKVLTGSTEETVVSTVAPDLPMKTKEPAESPDETVIPVPTEAIEEKNTLSCTLTVKCDTILNNMEKLTPEKVQLVPDNGIILSETELEFSEGDTVFDVLEKELKNRKIHLEFSKISMYDNSYIEGIGNLYEFDCGNLSGWMYRVNGKVPSMGCSQYEIKNGDKIEFLYTCNMGRDL